MTTDRPKEKRSPYFVNTDNNDPTSVYARGEFVGDPNYLVASFGTHAEAKKYCAQKNREEKERQYW